MNEAFTQKLKTVFSALGLECSDGAAQTLNAYYDFLVEYNQKVNLTAVTDEGGVILKHFADSLGGAREIPDGAKIIDVGSGAGFPGVVIKIFRPNADVTLLEPNGKKAKFLKELIGVLGLSGIRVTQDRAEVIGRGKGREAYDVVTARAVAALNTLAEYCLPLVKVGGKFIAYKGSKAIEEVRDAQNAIDKLGGSEPQLNDYPLDENARYAVVIKKVRPTPSIYPRANSKIAAKPL